ncbi:UNKNOWN [Stylonychia lemnae]|uniref:Uncharacterized protein n=1 Tax=Stylonychia lemnae TaxID=5949 RepID=A0A078B2T4_STYLE|nr:UNKNOWN [Stylonychia lemnae]|eukprot:CDW87532.1 UNKNOWN [Stylonychia lemnae]
MESQDAKDLRKQISGLITFNQLDENSALLSFDFQMQKKQFDEYQIQRTQYSQLVVILDASAKMDEAQFSIIKEKLKLFLKAYEKENPLRPSPILLACNDKIVRLKYTKAEIFNAELDGTSRGKFYAVTDVLSQLFHNDQMYKEMFEERISNFMRDALIQTRIQDGLLIRFGQIQIYLDTVQQFKEYYQCFKDGIVVMTNDLDFIQSKDLLRRFQVAVEVFQKPFKLIKVNYEPERKFVIVRDHHYIYSSIMRMDLNQSPDLILHEAQQALQKLSQKARISMNDIKQTQYLFEKSLLNHYLQEMVKIISNNLNLREFFPEDWIQLQVIKNKIILRKQQMSNRIYLDEIKASIDNVVVQEYLDYLSYCNGLQYIQIIYRKSTMQKYSKLVEILKSNISSKISSITEDVYSAFDAQENTICVNLSFLDKQFLQGLKKISTSKKTVYSAKVQKQEQQPLYVKKKSDSNNLPIQIKQQNEIQQEKIVEQQKSNEEQNQNNPSIIQQIQVKNDEHQQEKEIHFNELQLNVNDQKHLAEEIQKEVDLEKLSNKEKVQNAILDEQFQDSKIMKVINNPKQEIIMENQKTLIDIKKNLLKCESFFPTQKQKKDKNLELDKEQKIKQEEKVIDQVPKQQVPPVAAAAKYNKFLEEEKGNQIQEEQSQFNYNFEQLYDSTSKVCQQCHLIQDQRLQFNNQTNIKKRLDQTIFSIDFNSKNKVNQKPIIRFTQSHQYQPSNEEIKQYSQCNDKCPCPKECMLEYKMAAENYSNLVLNNLPIKLKYKEWLLMEKYREGIRQESLYLLHTPEIVEYYKMTLIVQQDVVFNPFNGRIFKIYKKDKSDIRLSNDNAGKIVKQRLPNIAEAKTKEMSRYICKNQKQVDAVLICLEDFLVESQQTQRNLDTLIVQDDDVAHVVDKIFKEFITIFTFSNY